MYSTQPLDAEDVDSLTDKCQDISKQWEKQQMNYGLKWQSKIMGSVIIAIIWSMYRKFISSSLYDFRKFADKWLVNKKRKHLMQTHIKRIFSNLLLRIS